MFANSLNEFSREARVTSKKILKMIVLIRQRAQTHDDNMRACILQIESVIRGFHHLQSPPDFQPQLINSPRGGDTPLGTVVVGGSDRVITVNLLFNLIRELQGKVELLTARAKHNGMLFNGLAFNSESELSAWFALHNSSGAGCAAMVNFQSIWAYANSDAADSSSWLNDMEKSRKMGLKGGRYKARYMHSMRMKYPIYFVGKEKNITSSSPSSCGEEMVWGTGTRQRSQRLFLEQWSNIAPIATIKCLQEWFKTWPSRQRSIRCVSGTHLLRTWMRNTRC